MKVLQICLKPPLPSKDGGCKAMHNITKGLIDEQISVKVLTIATDKHSYLPEMFPPGYVESTGIEHVHLKTAVSVKDAFFNLFKKESYNITRFINKQFEQLIASTLTIQDYDIVLLESLYVTPYIPVIRKNSDAKIVYRAHNVEHRIWERRVAQELSFKKSYVKLLAKRLKTYESSTLNLVDGIAAITEKDQKEFQSMGAKVPIAVIPFGIELMNYQMVKASSNTCFHIGSMDWQPNEEGIKWLLKEVWPEVIKKHQGIQLVLAGRNMPSWLSSLNQEQVIVEGEVTDANQFISDNGIMVVPLFTGSGMRVKIIEGMALGRLVIATTVGAEGISCHHQEDIIIADTKEEFISAINHYHVNPSDQDKIVKKARLLIEKNYDNRIIVNNLVTFFKQL